LNQFASMLGIIRDNEYRIFTAKRKNHHKNEVINR